MKKHIIGSILLSAALLLSSCGGKSEKTAYTAEDVTVLLDAGVFSGEMEQVDGAVAVGLFGLDAAAVEEITCYMAINSSVSADEVAVFVLTDEEAAQAAESACQAFCAAGRHPRISGARASQAHLSSHWARASGPSPAGTRAWKYPRARRARAMRLGVSPVS